MKDRISCGVGHDLHVTVKGSQELHQPFDRVFAKVSFEETRETSGWLMPMRVPALACVSLRPLVSLEHDHLILKHILHS